MVIRTKLFFLFVVCYLSASGQSLPPKREFRGVWIASVMNIDWPSQAGLDAEKQRLEFLKTIQLHKANGMNAVVVQVRPSADAFYPSRYEPWSKWLTGKLGKSPQPYYDPLEFMIKETHRLGLEFHAWFNPYRGVVNVEAHGVDSASLAFQKPEWFVRYDKNLYFNPGLPEVRQHVTNVVMDVVTRYDVDGIHFDDYFYPYKVAKLSFPDSATFAQYGKSFQHVDDWRRANVDALIKAISDSVREAKPHVKFGVSPFGVWRNKDKDPTGSATRAGQTCYDDLYADVLKWMREGWIDYVTPQIYWSIGFELAAYEVLVKWWNENSNGKPVYIGQATYRINAHNDDRWKQGNQIPNQIRLNRSLANIQGSTYFSSKSFVPNPLGINDSLKSSFYKYPALLPTQHNKLFEANYPLSFTTDESGITLHWREENALKDLSPHRRYVIYRFDAGEKVNIEDPSKILAVLTDTNPHATTVQRYTDQTAKLKRKYIYAVTSLNRFQVESSTAQGYAVKKYKKYWRTY
ncbi:MAG: glycoside hydrolase family 10 protein [Bacteroidota bacterium]